MQKELEQIIKAYGLENTRIQRGRQRIYPHREGLEPTVQQITDLKSVLDGTSVKGFLEIKSGQVVIAANTAGAIERAFDRSSMPAQTQLFTPELPFESNTEAPPTQDPFDRALEKSDRIDEGFDRMEVLIEQMNPNSNVVDAKARFEAISTTPEPILDSALIPGQKEVIDAEKVSQPSDQASDPSVVEAPRPVLPDELTNEMAKSQYMDLLQVHPNFAGTHASIDDLKLEPEATQKRYDSYVKEVAQGLDVPLEDFTKILAQGSPFVISSLDAKISTANDTKMSVGLDYLTTMASEYQSPILHKAEVPDLPSYENIPHEVEQVANQATYNKFPQASNQAQEVDLESVAAPTVESPKELNSDLDYPNDAQTLDPTVNLKSAIAQGTATIQEKVLSASETLKLAQKNMATFAKQVKHRGLKVWAKEQLPILQTKAIKLAQVQAAKMGDYVKEQAPIVKESAIAAAKQAGEYVKEQTPIVKEAVIAGAKQAGEYVKEYAPIAKDAVIAGTQQAIEYAKEQAPLIRDAVIAGAIKTGDTIFQLDSDSPTLIDASKINALSECVLAGDSEFQGKTFDFTKTDTGVEISLKNGTPVFANGQLNPKLEESYKLELNKLAQKVTEFKPVSLIEKKAKAASR
jgi:hypothetical protein